MEKASLKLFALISNLISNFGIVVISLDFTRDKNYDDGNCVFSKSKINMLIFFGYGLENIIYTRASHNYNSFLL